MRSNIFSILGAILLLIASVLLIVTSITAPVVNNMAIMTVDLPNGLRGEEVSFGTFGWCVQEGASDGGDLCSKAKIGYDPAAVMFDVDRTQTASYSRKTTRALTRVMVLHPVGAGLNFIAFGLALGASVLGSIAATLFALLAFLVTAVVMICDFVLFSIIRNDVNDVDNGSHARFSVGIWCVLASAIASLLGAVIMFASCCAAGLRKRRERRKVHSHVGNGHSHGYVEKRQRRRFWNRR